MLSSSMQVPSVAIMNEGSLYYHYTSIRLYIACTCIEVLVIVHYLCIIMNVCDKLKVQLLL